ncbi:nhp2l1 [Symbiodinium sp. CCMP2456]|nr:nhp2l1 [Symbiodinium sp. CCMP2456]
MGVPDDANPMNRRLPAEVVTRKKQTTKKEEKEESSALQVDPKQVHGMKPEHRMKWLAKALQKCQEGKAEKTAIYDIMTHAKFSHDCSSKLGAKMYRLVRAHAVLFSQKQQKFLEGGDYPLHKLYKKAVKKGEVEEDEAGVTAERAEESSRKDASRSRDDARGPDIAALWDRLTALSPGERAARVAALDEATKENLEEFLEARINGAQSNGSGRDRGEEDERSPIAPAVEEESGYFSVTLRKLDLSLDTSDEDFLIIKEITPAVSKWNKSLPEHPIQVFDRLIEVNGTRARDAVEKAMHSSSEATLRFQRPQQRTVVLKQPGKLGVLANYVPARSLKPWIDTIARGAVDDWNKASPQQAIQEHDRIVCVNGVSEPAEEMLLELARQTKSSLRLTCLHYAGPRGSHDAHDSASSRSRSRSRRRRR